MKMVYIVIVEDRHTDDYLLVFDNPDSALKSAQSFQASYAKDWTDGEEWRVEKIPGWFYSARSYDDGPKIRIEAKELRS